MRSYVLASMQELRSVKNNESLTDDDDINRFDEEGDLEK